MPNQIRSYLLFEIEQGFSRNGAENLLPILILIWCLPILPLEDIAIILPLQKVGLPWTIVRGRLHQFGGGTSANENKASLRADSRGSFRLLWRGVTRL